MHFGTTRLISCILKLIFNVLFSTGNATYLSHQIQNQMIDTIGTAISEEIVRRLKEAEFFAVIVDETPDTSHKEQLSITVRYVRGGDVEERLLALRIVDQTSSEVLFETLCAVLRFHSIDVTNLRGQCYDGASNVAGIRTGLQARIKEISPSALFVHCYAHVLNLVIVDAMTSNTTARDFFGTLQNLYVFIQTCTKRHAVYTEQQAEIHANSRSAKSFQVRTLKSLCETRWACRADAINTFNATMEAIVRTLKHILETETKAKIAAEAKGLLANIDFEFVLALKVSIPNGFNLRFLCRYSCAMRMANSYDSHMEKVLFKIWI